MARNIFLILIFITKISSNTNLHANSLETLLLPAFDAVLSKMRSVKPICIAVYPFDNNSKKLKEYNIGLVFSEMLETYIKSNSEIKTAEREQISKIVNEIQINLSGLFDNSQIISVNTNTIVDYIILGSVSQLNNNIFVKIKCVSIKTGEIVVSHQLTVNENEVINIYDKKIEVIHKAETSTILVNITNTSIPAFIYIDGGKASECKSFLSISVTPGVHTISWLSENTLSKHIDELNYTQEQINSIRRAMANNQNNEQAWAGNMAASIVLNSWYKRLNYLKNKIADIKKNIYKINIEPGKTIQIYFEIDFSIIQHENIIKTCNVLDRSSSVSTINAGIINGIRLDDKFPILDKENKKVGTITIDNAKIFSSSGLVEFSRKYQTLYGKEMQMIVDLSSISTRF